MTYGICAAVMKMQDRGELAGRPCSWGTLVLSRRNMMTREHDGADVSLHTSGACLLRPGQKKPIHSWKWFSLFLWMRKAEWRVFPLHGPPYHLNIRVGIAEDEDRQSSLTRRGVQMKPICHLDIRDSTTLDDTPCRRFVASFSEHNLS